MVSKMKSVFVFLLMLAITSPSLSARRILSGNPSPTFNVVSYGAKGDGCTDDSQAFKKTWQDVCSVNSNISTMVIPKGGTFFLQPTMFNGPCKASTIKIEVGGTIVAPESMDEWKWEDNEMKAWLQFSHISGLILFGGGSVDAQGATWWNSHNDQQHRPTALKFNCCDNMWLTSLTHVNSPRNHISIDSCTGAFVSNLRIVAPEDSPNTDGIDIASSTNVFIQDSIIQTGDDCIAINSGSSFINITGILCGPGHGISVGSLGGGGSYNTVEEVHVNNCTFDRSTNGVRIKTWVGGTGYARKITFEDIVFKGAKNPVIIDQQYTDAPAIESCQFEKAVKITQITYRNMNGTSNGEDAIKLNCDSNVECTGIVLENIYITSEDGKDAQAVCTNACGQSSTCTPKVTCLKSGGY